MFAYSPEYDYIKPMGSAVRPSNRGSNMSQQHTYTEIATNLALWNEFVNVDAAMTDAEFDALSTEQKVSMQVELFGAEAAMSAIEQAKAVVLDQYSAAQAAECFAYAEAQGCTDADEFLSLAMSKILYSADQLASGARYEVAPGSVAEYFA